MKKIIANLFLMLVPSVVFAENTNIKLTNPISGGVNTVEGLFNKIIDYLIMIGGPILGIMVIWGAFQMLTAGDDEQKFIKGKHTITYAVIGFAIILLSKGFVLVLKEFLGVSQ